MALSELQRWIPLSGFVGGIAILSAQEDRSFAWDYPLTTVPLGFFCFIATLVIFGLSKLWPRALIYQPSAVGSTGIALEDLSQLHATRRRSGDEVTQGLRPSPRTAWLPLVLLTVAVAARAELFRQNMADSHCLRPGIEAFLPGIVALGDWWTRRRWLRQQPIPSIPSSSSRFALGQFRYVVPGLFAVIGGFASSVLESQVRSTYICPASVTMMAGRRQWAGVFLDAAGFCYLDFWLFERDESRLPRLRRTPVQLSYLFAALTLVLTITGYVLPIAIHPDETRSSAFEIRYLGELLWPTITITATIIFAFRSLASFELITLCVIAIFTSAYVRGIRSSITTSSAFSSAPLGRFFLSLTAPALFLGPALLMAFDGIKPGQVPSLTGSFKSSGKWFLALLIFLYLCGVMFEKPWSSPINVHPIETLMATAKTNHQDWLKQASSSKTLGKAVDEYRRRYDRHPPPGFDRWYDYATARSTVVMDDYDSIHHDLLPFWSLSPSELRLMTSIITADPWLMISRISVRKGKVEWDRSVMDTHRWMPRGVAKMMLPFAQWLPDMDLAFNLNDECRVAVPWADAQAMRRAGEKAGNLAIGKDTRWSQDRAAGWDPVDVDESAATVYFEDLQYNSSFKSYGTPLCPPGSRARQGQPWDAHVLCYSCARPHSHGPFIRNWTLAGDFCHQPDLSSLHGFFLSPSSFTGTRKLMPIFSQSKVHGYNDILYPSAWNYVDRVKYAPTKADPDSSFEKKQRTLLWRGSTTEGVSVVGTWKGMVRERLVHLANNFSSSDTVPLLVPTGQGSTGYRYRNTRLADLRGALDLDIGIVDVARCGDKDCVDQEETYGFKPPLNFQEHWKYKYLFDLDGAAFSGRFLPFLQSRSLPFKAALFREWSDSRLSAWLHFVPQDLRLHDVHSTLAYFAGLHSTIDGSKVKMEAHNDQAEFIAEQGRAWAAKVLRKEDMEIYTFRLLLEWGRLTDDRRDEIGFQM